MYRSAIADSSKDHTIARLKFLSCIQPGQKIDSNWVQIVSPNILSSLYRTFIGNDNRHKARALIESIFNSAYGILVGCISNIPSSNNDQLARTLIKDMYEAQIGVRNLTITYAKDSMYVCQMATLLQTYNLLLRSIRDENPTLFNGIDCDEVVISARDICPTPTIRPVPSPEGPPEISLPEQANSVISFGIDDFQPE